MAYLIISIIIVLADQLTKSWVSMNIESGAAVKLIPGVIHLTNALNTGAAFSMMSGKRWILIGVSAGAAVVIIYIIVKKMFGPIGMTGLAFILGGAIGNLIDRILFGSVVDMFEVEFFNFAIFNVADIFVTIGGVIFCVYYIVHVGKADGKKKAAVSADEEEPAPGPVEPPVIDESVFDKPDEISEKLSDTVGFKKITEPAEKPSIDSPTQAIPQFVWPKGSSGPVLASEVNMEDTEFEMPKIPERKQDLESTFIHSTLLGDEFADINWENSSSEEEYDFESILREYHDEHDN